MGASTNASHAHAASLSGGAMAAARLAKVQQDQMRMVLRNIAPSVFAMPMFAITISFLISKWISLPTLTLWVGAVTLSAGSLCAAYFAYERTAQRLSDLPRWMAFATALAVIFGLIWTAPALFFWSYCGVQGHFLFTLVFACSIAGASALQSPCPPLFVAMLVPYVFALVAPPLLEGTAFYYGIAALGFGFCLYMLHLARQVYLTARDMFNLREDKNDLIEQLTAAKIESDKARLRAENASQAKSEFLANMSHELRTPLNAILGFSDIMRNEVFGRLGSSQYVGYAGDIHSSGQHLLGLINDVLDLAKIEAGRYQVRAVEVDMREAIDSALTLFKVAASEASVDLVRDVDADLPLLLADERGMRQILLNLTSNALKFTRASGSVTVFARRASNGGMEVGVIDTGVGIDPADVDRVFEAFGQGQHEVAVREKGTGLGLSIVRGLVEAHGGKVKLDSTLGKGTTVTCIFPRERLTAPQPVPIRLATVL